MDCPEIEADPLALSMPNLPLVLDLKLYSNVLNPKPSVMEALVLDLHPQSQERLDVVPKIQVNPTVMSLLSVEVTNQVPSQIHENQSLAEAMNQVPSQIHDIQLSMEATNLMLKVPSAIPIISTLIPKTISALASIALVVVPNHEKKPVSICHAGVNFVGSETRLPFAKDWQSTCPQLVTQPLTAFSLSNFKTSSSSEEKVNIFMFYRLIVCYFLFTFFSCYVICR